MAYFNSKLKNILKFMDIENQLLPVHQFQLTRMLIYWYTYHKRKVETTKDTVMLKSSDAFFHMIFIYQPLIVTTLWFIANEFTMNCFMIFLYLPIIAEMYYY